MGNFLCCFCHVFLLCRQAGLDICHDSALWNICYIFFLSKLEENIIFVLLASAKLPDIVYGSFNKPLPLDKKSTDELKISEE